MKKLIFAAAVAAGMGAFALDSANVVGYLNTACSAGKFGIAAVQFEGVGTGKIDLNKVVSGMTGVEFGDGVSFKALAPQIQVPNVTTGGYDVYYYLSDGYSIAEDGKTEVLKEGWCDQFGTYAGDTVAGAIVSGEVTPGFGIWIKSVQTDALAVQSGEVSADVNTDIDVPMAFTIRANAFPISFNLNDSSKVTFSGLTPAEFGNGVSFKATAPQIQVPNATTGGYDVYYYLSDGYSIAEDGKTEVLKEGWCDQFGTYAGDTVAGAIVSGDIAAGVGFWAKGVKSEFTISFKQ